MVVAGTVRDGEGVVGGRGGCGGWGGGGCSAVVAGRFRSLYLKLYLYDCDCIFLFQCLNILHARILLLEGEGDTYSRTGP